MNVSNKQVGPSMETMTVTERLLSDCFGGAVRLGDGEDLGGSSRSKVYRFSVFSHPGGMPEHVTLCMEEAYRAELVKGCPEAADDILFYRAVVEACVFWMLDW